MRFVLVALLALHGAVHALGLVKALRPAAVAQLQQPIALRAGALWLAAALLLLTAAAMLLLDARAWWAPALAGVVLSQALIVSAWSDARYGTLANLIVLVPLAVVLLDFRGGSLRSAYRRDVRQALARPETTAVVGDADLAPLPVSVQQYLRRAGVVGRPRVRSFHATFTGEIRGGPDAPWMPARIDQYEFFRPPQRYFFMTATRAGVPFDALHRYVGDEATMRARVAGLVPVLDVSGRALTQSETVTLLNDMCLLAPAALVDAPIVWQTLDDHTVRATFTNAGYRVSALLTFDASGDLAGFRSEDRYQMDGKRQRLLPWSTPVSDYRDFGGVRLAAHGEARWTEPTGEWTYGRFTVRDVAYNVSAADHPASVAAAPR